MLQLLSIRCLALTRLPIWHGLYSTDQQGFFHLSLVFVPLWSSHLTDKLVFHLVQGVEFHVPYLFHCLQLLHPYHKATFPPTPKSRVAEPKPNALNTRLSVERVMELLPLSSLHI